MKPIIEVLEKQLLLLEIEYGQNELNDVVDMDYIKIKWKLEAAMRKLTQTIEILKK